jgi:hypothetical protein
MIPLPVGGVLIEPGGLSDTFGQVFREVTDVATSFLGATEDALDVHLGAEPDHVGGFGEVVARLLPRRQWLVSVGVGEGFGRMSQTGRRSPV